MSRFENYTEQEKKDFDDNWDSTFCSNMSTGNPLKFDTRADQEACVHALTKTFRTMLRRASSRGNPKISFHILKEQIKQAIALFEKQVYVIDCRELDFSRDEIHKIEVIVGQYSGEPEILRPMQYILLRYVCFKHSYKFQGKMIYAGYDLHSTRFFLFDEAREVLEGLFV